MSVRQLVPLVHGSTSDLAGPDVEYTPRGSARGVECKTLRRHREGRGHIERFEQSLKRVQGTER